MSRNVDLPNGWLFLFSMGIFFIIWGISHYLYFRNILISGVRCQATVIDCTQKTRYSPKGGTYKDEYTVYLTLTYDGYEHTITRFEWAKCPKTNRLPVVYNPKEPKDIMIDHDGFKLPAFMKVYVGLYFVVLSFVAKFLSVIKFRW